MSSEDHAAYVSEILKSLDEVPPLTDEDIAAIEERLASVSFPIPAQRLHEEIGLDECYLFGRHYVTVRDGVEWVTAGQIHEKWAVRYRDSSSESGEQIYEDFQIVEFSPRTPEVAERARQVGILMRDLAVKGEMRQYVQSRDFPDVVILPTRFTNSIADLGSKIAGADVVVYEMEDDCDYSHRVEIRSEHDQFSMQLNFDAGWDKFHIVPGTSNCQEKQLQ